MTATKAQAIHLHLYLKQIETGVWIAINAQIECRRAHRRARG